MSIKNLLTNNLKPDQDLQVNSVITNELDLGIEFSTQDYTTSGQTATITARNAIVQFTGFPTGKTVNMVETFTINQSELGLTDSIVQVTVDTNGTGTPATGQNSWYSIVNQVSVGSVSINIIYTNSANASNNPTVRFYISIFK